MDADAPDPAAEIARLKSHRSVLCRALAYMEQRVRRAEAEVARLRAELKAKEGAQSG